MKNLTIFRGVPIPADYASTQTYALLAKRDGGKTYTTLKFEEQMCDAGLFFVTLDPVGKHWALRAGPDGKEAGGKNDVWVLGGAHGDVPLEANSGELIADIVVEHPGRYVLDVSHFETDAEQDRFATAFAKRLFRRKARDAGFPLLVILEEAEAFIPERPQSGQQQMLGAFGRIMRQGRNHGLGMWMVAQRAQALNKGVLSQAEVLVVKQMAHKRDRDAVEDWVKANGTDAERAVLMDSLASLDQRDAWVWSPSWLRVFEQARVLPRVTFDSSASVKGHAAQKAVKLVPLDVDALGAKMAQVAEKGKQEDPRELRKQLAQAQRTMAEQQRTIDRAPKQAAPVEVEVPVPVAPEGAAVLVRDATSAAATARTAAERAETALMELHDGLVKLDGAEVSRRPAKAARARAATPAPPAKSRLASQPTQAPSPTDLEGVSLKKGARSILTLLAQMHPQLMTRRQVATQVGIKSGGSTFSSYLSNLRIPGLISESGDRLGITQAGFDFLGEAPPPPPTPQEVVDKWRGTLKRGARAMLDALIRSYPEGLSRDDLADTGDRPIEPGGSTLSSYLSNLRTAELIEEQDGTVYLAEAFAEIAA